jgi:hypothetical protein
MAIILVRFLTQKGLRFPAERRQYKVWLHIRRGSPSFYVDVVVNADYNKSDTAGQLQKHSPRQILPLLSKLIVAGPKKYVVMKLAVASFSEIAVSVLEYLNCTAKNRSQSCVRTDY